MSDLSSGSDLSVGLIVLDHETGWSCSHDPLDYAYVLAFCDYVAVSSFASKEAAKLLRKELKVRLFW